jgi:hypothetical protein
MEDDMREFTKRETVGSQYGKALWPITLFIAFVLVTLSVPAALVKKVVFEGRFIGLPRSGIETSH